MGSIYRYKKKMEDGTVKELPTWWIKYYRKGTCFRESSGSTVKAVAKELLKSREGQVVDGRFVGLRAEKILFDDLAEKFLEDYRINKKKSLDRAERSVKQLSEYFKGRTASDIANDPDLIDGYIAQRQKDGVENATVNRELAALKRMFNLAIEKKKIIYAPHIPHLAENNVRKGFFEHEEYLKMMGVLPGYLKLPFTLAYSFGLRKEEVFSLTWNQVNLIDGKITLEETKNGESRIAPLKAETYEAVAGQKQIRDSLYPDCPYVCFREGNRIKDFRSAWETALKKIGIRPAFKCKDCGKVTELPAGVKREELKCYACGSGNLKKHDKLWHDLRRTAVRNMVRAGISRTVAKAISGHKTDSVFERYDITDERDLQDAADKISAFHSESQARIDRINAGLRTGRPAGRLGQNEAERGDEESQ